MVNELAGKVAIVTGGASGIGCATAERFLAERARVVIADVDRDGGEALAAKLSTNALFQRTDVSNPEQVEAVVAAAVEKFGGLHVMVNNAGSLGHHAPPIPGVMTYRASKAAVIQFTKSAAIELAYYGIRVNTIAPGNLPTPLLATSAAAMDHEEIERYTRGDPRDDACRPSTEVRGYTR